MKASGSTLFMIVLTLMVVVTTVFSIVSTTYAGESQTRSVVLQKDYHTVSTALDGATIYLKTALRYAVYQALYEINLGANKWYEGNPNEESFKEKLKVLIDKTLAKYTTDTYTFLEANYLVFLPKYNSTVELMNGVQKVNATSTDRLKIDVSRPRENIILEKSVSLTEGFDYPVLDALKLVVADGKDAINTSAYEYFNKTWKTQAEAKLVGCDKKGQEISNVEVFNSRHNTTFNDTEDAAKYISAELDGVVSKIVGNQTNLTVQITPNSTVSVVTNCDVKRDDFCGQNFTYTYTKSCDFEYNYQINTGIVVEDRAKFYPVKLADSKDIVFVNQQLTFQHTSWIHTNRFKATT